MAPSAKRTKAASTSSQQHATITDPRFTNIQTDPRFRLPSRKHSKVKLDSRFARVLEDEDFSRKASVDRYGRKVAKGSGKQELERFYRLEDHNSDHDSEGQLTDDEVVQNELSRIDKAYDPARGGGFSSSDEDSEDEEEEEMQAENVNESGVELADSNIEVPLGEISSRIAAVNLDWDNIRAVDLMAVASSFVPASGRIVKVTIYPSEFGKERMEREELEGPPQEIFAALEANQASNSEDSDAEEQQIKNALLEENEGKDFDSSALRAYQLDRLRYYYAVIYCSSPAVGESLYNDMDGREYLSSANFFDLRFIPDDVSFDGDKPHDECTKVPDGYKPAEFVTEALTHSKVKLTWDADDASRKEAQKRAFSRAKMDENDLQAYIGSDSSGEDGTEEEEDNIEPEDPGTTRQVTHESKIIKKKTNKASALRAALGLGAVSSITKKRDADAPVGDMEITFTPGLSVSLSKEISNPKNVQPAEETTLERYKRKEKERKERRRERARLARGDEIASSGSEEDGGIEVEWQEETGSKKAITDPLRPRTNPSSSKKKSETTGSVKGEELGFDDPFFTNLMSSKPGSVRSKSKTRTQLPDATNNRAELELLMAPEGKDALEHFDMAAIEKAEKAARRTAKKGKIHRKGAEKTRDGIGLQENFRMDVSDPRFARLYESHDFAIDPTNPRFKSTKGMKALLNEGRRRRDRYPALVEKESKNRKRQHEGERGQDLGKLVERVRKRAKA